MQKNPNHRYTSKGNILEVDFKPRKRITLQTISRDLLLLNFILLLGLIVALKFLK